jgi:deoxyribodipyrimidine photo-lyase
MSKRIRSLSSISPSATPQKKTKVGTNSMPLRIATARNAEAVDKDPPLAKLLQAVENGIKKPEKGGCVAYWMRMGDLRGAFAVLVQSSFPTHCGDSFRQ